jgi:Zn-dependent protease
MWSWKVGTILGIALKIHATFPLALLYAAYQFGSTAGRGENQLLYALYGAALVLVLFLCVLLHELGHAVAALRLGVPVAEIVLLPIGGLAKLKMVKDDAKQEFIIAGAGPLVNLIITIILIPLLVGWLYFLYPDVLSSWQGQWRSGFWYIVSYSLRAVSQISLTGALTYLILSNILLVVFNLIPAFPMDGGRLFRAFLAWFLPYRTATTIAVRIGQLLALVFGFFGFQNNPGLVLVAVFIFGSGFVELQRVQLRSVLELGTITAFMRRGLHPLFPQWNLYAAQLLSMQTGQSAFPVVEGGRLLGLLTMREVDATTPQRTVAEAMISDYPVVSPDGSLYDAQIALAHNEQYAAAVMDKGVLLGLISIDDIERGYNTLRQQKKPAFI